MNSNPNLNANSNPDPKPDPGPNRRLPIPQVLRERMEQNVPTLCKVIGRVAEAIARAVVTPGVYFGDILLLRFGL